MKRCGNPASAAAVTKVRAAILAGRDPFPDAEGHAVNELVLFIDNDAELYRQQHTPINRSLITKKARGIYDRLKAWKLFTYLADAGAQKYTNEHDVPSREHGSFGIFSPDDRASAAWELLHFFEVEADLGNYDHLLPKKYRKASNPRRSRLLRRLRRRGNPEIVYKDRRGATKWKSIRGRLSARHGTRQGGTIHIRPWSYGRAGKPVKATHAYIEDDPKASGGQPIPRLSNPQRAVANPRTARRFPTFAAILRAAWARSTGTALSPAHFVEALEQILPPGYSTNDVMNMMVGSGFFSRDPQGWFLLTEYGRRVLRTGRLDLGHPARTNPPPHLLILGNPSRGKSCRRLRAAGGRSAALRIFRRFHKVEKPIETAVRCGVGSGSATIVHLGRAVDLKLRGERLRTLAGYTAYATSDGKNLLLAKSPGPRFGAPVNDLGQAQRVTYAGPAYSKAKRLRGAPTLWKHRFGRGVRAAATSDLHTIVVSGGDLKVSDWLHN